MNDADVFQKMLPGPERRLLARLSSPAKIQAFLDELANSHEDRYRGSIESSDPPDDVVAERLQLPASLAPDATVQEEVHGRGSISRGSIRS